MKLTTKTHGPYSLAAPEGGGAELFEGEDSAGRPVVAKLVAPAAVERLRLLADAEIDGVVPILDHIEIDGTPAVVLPRLSGDLGPWLYGLREQADSPASLALLLGRMARLAEALAELHALGGAGWVHRDVKPENVLMDEEGSIWLADFDGLSSGRAPSLSVLGTPRWAPLDQLLAGAAPLDPTWDTAALCGMLFVGLTGQHPAHSEDPREQLTPLGRELWQQVQRIQRASAEELPPMYEAFLAARKDAALADVLAEDAPAAPGKVDRDLLASALRPLMHGLPASARKALQGQLWQLVLSALSVHPEERLSSAVLASRLRALEQLARTPARALPSPPPALARPSGGASAPRVVRASGYGVAMWVMAGFALLGVILAMPQYGAYRAALQEEEAGGASGDRVQIPGGVALVGGADVLVKPFEVDRTERTLADWRACQFAGECRMRLLVGEDGHPVVGLTEEDAMALCEYFGGRLPRRGEWERLVGETTYPWGDEPPTCERTVLGSCEGGVQPVGGHPAGANRWGVLDLAGNAAEWVRANNPTETPWIMGGSAISEEWQLRNDAGTPFRGRASYDMAGARCVYER